MKRTRTLGIAVIMALALTAFAGATTASANNFKVAVEPATWSGSITGKNHVLSLNGESFTCSNVAFSGETTIKTLSSVTVSPELSACAHNGFSVGWTTNGCKLRFKPGAGPALTGAVDIVGCEKPMTNVTGSCITEIGNQAGLGIVTYKNVAGSPATVTAVANLASITFTRSGAGCAGAYGTFNNGTYSGEWTLKGSVPGGGPPAAVEVESTSAAPFTKFAAEEAPVTIAGTGTAGSVTYFKTIGGNAVNCKSYSLKGSSAGATATSITLTPTYKECTVGGEAVPDGYVSAGGCSYVFNVNGTFDIVGATCATNPITITRAGCIATIGPQSGLSGFSFANEGSGKLRGVSMSGSTGQNLTYTSTGPSCASQGTGTTGNIISPAKLTAANSGGAPQGISVE